MTTRVKRTADKITIKLVAEPSEIWPSLVWKVRELTIHATCSDYLNRELMKGALRIFQYLPTDEAKKLEKKLKKWL